MSGVSDPRSITVSVRTGQKVASSPGTEYKSYFWFFVLEITVTSERIEKFSINLDDGTFGIESRLTLPTLISSRFRGSRGCTASRKKDPEQPSHFQSCYLAIKLIAL